MREGRDKMGKKFRTKGVVFLSALLVIMSLFHGTVSYAAAEYEMFLNRLDKVEQYAKAYQSGNTSVTDTVDQLVLSYIRSGNPGYTGSYWDSLAGAADSNFIFYVAAKDAAEGTDAAKIRTVSAVTLPNGEEMDVFHLFAVMNMIEKDNGDLGGWAGDTCQLLYTVMKLKDESTPPETLTASASEAMKNDASGFGRADLYADLDGYNLWAVRKADGSRSYKSIFTAYYESLTDKNRASAFSYGRFGLTDASIREDYRSKVLSAYFSNTSVMLLEKNYFVSGDAFRNRRTACCQAFADYLYDTVNAPPYEPVVTASPSAASVETGTALSGSVLSGGEVQYKGTGVPGTWSWDAPETVPALTDSGKTLYGVTFTPDDHARYHSVQTEITITVKKAEVPASPANASGEIDVPEGMSVLNESSVRSRLAAALSDILTPAEQAVLKNGGSVTLKMVLSGGSDSATQSDAVREVTGEDEEELLWLRVSFVKTVKTANGQTVTTKLYDIGTAVDLIVELSGSHQYIDDYYGYVCTASDSDAEKLPYDNNDVSVAGTRVTWRIQGAGLYLLTGYASVIPVIDDRSAGGDSSGSAAKAGTWMRDGSGWWYRNADGSYPKECWKQIGGKWYCFDAEGYVRTGWILETGTGKWYHMDRNSCAMDTGWYFDSDDGHWYYLNADGAMAVGWICRMEKWYYLNPANTEGATYDYDGASGYWIWNGSAVRPYGAMYAGEETPDAFRVNGNGEWIR